MNRILSIAVLTLVLMIVIGATLSVYFNSASPLVDLTKDAIYSTDEKYAADDLASWLEYNKTTISGSQVFELAETYKDTNMSFAIKGVNSNNILVIGQPMRTASFDGNHLVGDQTLNRVATNYGFISNVLSNTANMVASPYLVNVEALYTTYLIRDSGNSYIGIYVVPVL